MLALLGWNDGTEQEIFGMEELIQKFSVERISKAGAKFDFEKAKWYNQEWIKQAPNSELMPEIKSVLEKHNVDVADFGDNFIETILDLVKERLTYIEDFWEQASFFFQKPETYDVDAVKPKWNDDKTKFFNEVASLFKDQPVWEASVLEPLFKNKITESGMKMGELMMPFRIMLVGGKFGPDVFKITEALGKDEVVERIKLAVPKFQN
jgi:glutamyl-tRNA synthetase